MTCITKVLEQTLKIQAALGREGFADEIADYIGCDASRVLTLARYGHIRIEGLVHPANREPSLAA